MDLANQRSWLFQWYDDMKNHRVDCAADKKREIEKHLDEITDENMVRFYRLLLVRYYSMNKESAKAVCALAETDVITEEDGQWLNYYYFFFRRIYHYDQRNYKAAIECYVQAQYYFTEFDPMEIAELYYKLASAYHRTYQISLSIEYATKALKIFTDHRHLYRMASCENILGLNHTDIKQYYHANKHYQNALLYVKNNDYLKMFLFHNMGLTYSKKSEPKMALYYLRQAYAILEQRNDYLKAQNLFLLATNYFKTGNMKMARATLRNGLEFCDEYDIEEYYHHLNLLKAKFVEPVRFEETYIQSITYFSDLELWEFVIEYGEELASYYGGIENFKKANDYYQLTRDARNYMNEEREIAHV